LDQVTTLPHDIPTEVPRDVDEALDQELDVAKAQVITTCLPNTGNVQEAWETIKPALTADSGHIWLDATSGRSDEAAALAEALWSEHKIGYLDCAVSGGP